MVLTEMEVFNILLQYFFSNNGSYFKFLHSRAHVHLLRSGWFGTAHAEIFMVEEILNSNPAGTWSSQIFPFVCLRCGPDFYFFLVDLEA